MHIQQCMIIRGRALLSDIMLSDILKKKIFTTSPCYELHGRLAIMIQSYVFVTWRKLLGVKKPAKNWNLFSKMHASMPYQSLYGHVHSIHLQYCCQYQVWTFFQTSTSVCETTEAVHGMLAASTLPEASAASATMDSPATATSAGVGPVSYTHLTLPTRMVV